MDSLIQTVKDNNLKLTLSFGIALHHAGLHERDRKIAEELFVNQKVQVNSRFLYLFTYIFLYLINQYKHGLYDEVQNYQEPWGVRGQLQKTGFWAGNLQSRLKARQIFAKRQLRESIQRMSSVHVITHSQSQAQEHSVNYRTTHKSRASHRRVVGRHWKSVRKGDWK